MITSVPPISDSSPSRRAPADWPAARAAGWSRAELWWERLQEEANGALQRGERTAAIRRFRLAWLLSLVALGRSDPRHATSVANAAAAAELAGAAERARRGYASARRLWDAVPQTVASVDIVPRARSSLFHLRMEALHRETFDANRRRRLLAFVAEAGETLDAMAEGRSARHRHFPRWLGEKPPIFDGSRRILAACLLLAVPADIALLKQTPRNG